MSNNKEDKGTKVVGTSDMPEPQIIDYSSTYSVTEQFKRDLILTINELPYIEARQILEYYEKYNWSIPTNILNESIRHISRLPYKYVCGIMKNIETNFSNYFTLNKKDERK